MDWPCIRLNGLWSFIDGQESVKNRKHCAMKLFVLVCLKKTSSTPTGPRRGMRGFLFNFWGGGGGGGIFIFISC